MPGPFDNIISSKLRGEIDTRIQNITAALSPKLDAMIAEQRKTNQLLDAILKELEYQRRQRSKE